MNAEVKKSYSNGFTSIGNAVFCEGLSLKARGLLCTMLSLPRDWHYSVAGLVKLIGEGKDSVRKGLDELKTKGFLKIEQVREKGKIVGTHWTISDTPMELVAENPTVVKKASQPEAKKAQEEKPYTENPPQQNKHRQNKQETKYSPYIPQRGNVGGEKPIQKQKRTSRKKEQQEKQEQEAQLVQGLFHLYSNGEKETVQRLNEWMELRNAKGVPFSVVSVRKNLEQLDGAAKQSGLSVPEYLDQIIMRGWSGFFPVPNMAQVWGKRFGEGEPVKNPTEGCMRRTKPLYFEVQA